MKHLVDGWNNFCRVFELPEKFSNEYCFNGGIPTNFQMVDWFQPINTLEADIDNPAVSKEIWEAKVGPIKTVTVELEDVERDLFPFLAKKNYIRVDRSYLIIYNFGACSILNPSKMGEEVIQ